MSVSTAKGTKGHADILASRIVRSRGYCQKCGTQAAPFQCAHIIGRRYIATRCVEDNLWCLCPPCHIEVDEWPHQKMWLVERTIGVDRYKELCALAQASVRGSRPVFWTDTLAQLKARCVELGLDARRRVPG